MATILKSSQREFKEDPNKIDHFRIFSDISIAKAGVKPQNLNFDLRQLNSGQYAFAYHFHRYAEKIYGNREKYIAIRKEIYGCRRENKRLETMTELILNIKCNTMKCRIIKKGNLKPFVYAYAFLFCTAVSCMAQTVVKENRETAPFQRIITKANIDIYFTQDDTYSIVVETDKKYVDKIITEVKDETLVVEWKEGKWEITETVVSKVYVSAPSLNKVYASGSSDFYVDNLKCEGSFQLNVSGASDVNIINLTVAKNVNISISGGADSKIDNLTVGDDVKIVMSGGADGSINNLTVKGNTNVLTSGGADCKIKNLQTNSCNLAADGGSDLNIKLTVSENLKAQASGGADIDISGKANNVKLSTSGSADIDASKLTYSNITIHKSGESNASE
ncbi:MAG: DUF2807 domain-containing protein [Bacteroidales bacterium]|jgi:hypothetical protein|nr:DUF2807 domain-containing protein [Bacteroidales bacterium]